MLNPDKYAQDFAKLHASYEKQAYPIVKRMLDQHCQAVTRYAETNGIGLTNALLAVLIDQDITRKALQEVYTLVGVRHARNYSRLLDRMTQPAKHGLPLLETKLVGFSSEFWRNVMEQYFRTEAAGKVTNVDQTTIEDIRRVLGEAQAQNLDVRGQARYLRETLNDARFNATRALLIARTESTVAANHSAYAVAEEADFELLKGWSAANDGRTRNSHRMVGSKNPIEQNALFEVPSPNGLGMEYARYPGDSTLSAANVIHCRCAVYHVPAYDSEGLPVPKR